MNIVNRGHRSYQLVRFIKEDGTKEYWQDMGPRDYDLIKDKLPKPGELITRGELKEIYSNDDVKVTNSDLNWK